MKSSTSSSTILKKSPRENHNGNNTINTWKNLNDLISTYQDSNTLPTILSPNLPSRFENVLKQNNLKAPKSTYPNDEDIRRNKKSKFKDDEEIPLSMLSPTLPAQFEEQQSQQRSTSTPKPSTPSSFTNKSNKVGTFKWINKVYDPVKPKFLMRINFNNRLKYKNKFTRETTPSKLTGFKIDTEKSVEKVEKDSKNSNEVEQLQNNFKSQKEVYEKEIDDRKKECEKLNLEKEAIVRKLNLEKEAIVEEKDNSMKILEKTLKELQEAHKKSIASVKELEELLEKERNKEKVNKEKPSTKESNNEDEQRKRNQLKQLTQDIIMREGSQPPVEEKILIDNFQDDSMSKNLTQQQREEIKNNLINKKNHYLQLSKTMTSRYQNSSDEFLKIIMQVDCILVKIISFDYDERSKVVSRVLPSERSWRQLDIEIEELIKKIDKINPNFSNIKFDLLKIVHCILYQARAIIMKRINNILSTVIESYISRNEKTKENNLNIKIIELQQQLILNNKLIIENFMNSKPNYLNSIIPLKFSYTWYNKSLNLTKTQQDYNLNNYHKNLKPPQLYYLPFGDYTNINELNGFLYNILKEFIEIYNKIYQNQPIKYNLQSNS
ncbi:unnamed protein product [Candida verbasci]|uniref:Uncharacterized protein n=1 Tax=Candida verbasci TaxID=1227364 RepID=A0A9W4X9R9_9ASCO|nr:unnamed protein product [Candida verbasci]